MRNSDTTKSRFRAFWLSAAVFFVISNKHAKIKDQLLITSLWSGVIKSGMLEVIGSDWKSMKMFRLPRDVHTWLEYKKVKMPSGTMGFKKQENRKLTFLLQFSWHKVGKEKNSAFNGNSACEFPYSNEPANSSWQISENSQLKLAW